MEQIPMRCFVRKVGKGYHAAFDWAGVSYTRSLRTQNERGADVRLGSIRDTPYRLEQGTLRVPTGADAKIFILSSGCQTQKQQPVSQLTVGELADKFLD
jgi:hypothetical protein